MFILLLNVEPSNQNTFSVWLTKEDGFIRYLTTGILLFSNPVLPPPRTPIRLRHNTLFSYWENPNTLFWIQETALRDLLFLSKDIGVKQSTY